MSTPAPAAVQRNPGAGRRFFWNFSTLILIGTAAYSWAAYYSDQLPEITAILSGGGLLTWAAAAFSLLRQDSQEGFRSWMEKAIFSSRFFTSVSLVALIGLVVLPNFAGSVQVQSVAEEGEHTAWIYPVGQQPSADPLRVAAEQPVRKVVTTSWFSPRSVVVKVAGYPKKVVVVPPFHRVQVTVPGSLRTPVLLFRPTQELASIAQGASMKLALTDDHGKAVAQPVAFAQDAILTGGEDDLTLPSELTEKWRAEVPKRRDLLDRWMFPSAPPEWASLQVTEKQILRAQVLQSNNRPYGPWVRVMVNPLRTNKSFVQEVVIDVKQ